MQKNVMMASGGAVLALVSAAAAQPMGGPMVHLMVELHDDSVLHVHVQDADTPVMRNYGEQYDAPADVLNGTMFNAQYGWMVEGFWQLPDGASVWLELLEQSAGLRTFARQTFEPIFGTDGASALLQWDGRMMHNWYAATTPGEYQATYRAFIGDGAGVPLDGFEPAEVTVRWIAVPGSGTAAIGGVGLAMGVARRRR